MTSRVLRIIPLTSKTVKRNFHPSNVRSVLYQSDKKSDFPIIHDRPPIEKDLSVLGHIREGYRGFVKETKLFLEECKDAILFTPKVVNRHCEDDVFFRFTDDVKCLDKWVTTCDSDYHLGFSKAKLELSPEGTGIFSGFVDKTVPQDGVTHRSGLCNTCTTPPMKSFKRDTYYDWSEYNYLSVRVRGDGRPYLININTPQWYDLSWNDVYNYVLYTRGGPYWQYTKIPFSKFVFSSKARIQDKQILIPLENISTINISADSKIEGPFRLEIDYIGLGTDALEWEETAYESYKTKLIQ